MSLYDILACPTCKTAVVRHDNTLQCTQCHQTYPIINNTPVMLPKGEVPAMNYQPPVQTTYHPWIYRVVLRSLLDNHIVLDAGSGAMKLDDPGIIRMDITLTPDVDVVGDLHAIPFLPGSIDFLFSLAVVEHLRNPFIAAQEMYDVLKDGGYIYQECNFVFPYHGYPHHYFNASINGMEQIFAQFRKLRASVATYQMPSFALQSLISSYLNYTQAHHYQHGKPLIASLQQVLEHPLMEYDIYFTEDVARYVAAGTFFFGIKQSVPDATVIPPVIQATWHNNPTAQQRYPDMMNIGIPENILLWAQGEGRQEDLAIADYLDHLVPFNKRGPDAPWDRSAIKALEPVEPAFGAVGYPPGFVLPPPNADDDTQDEQPQQEAPIATHTQQTEQPLSSKALLIHKSITTLRRSGWKGLLTEVLRYVLWVQEKDRH